MDNPQSRKRTGGPRTPEGKRRSSLNALKHGLRARSPQAIALIASEVNGAFDRRLDDLRAHYRPADLVEDRLVRRIARCLWRFGLSEAMEGRVISRRGVPNSPGGSYERILKYERLVDIHLHRAIHALNAKRADVGTHAGSSNPTPVPFPDSKCQFPNGTNQLPPSTA